jgi:type I site-specific restriction endonuclease
MSDNQNPEQKARDTIDALLKQAGWIVQSAKRIDLNAGLGQAVREYQTDVGPADYVSCSWIKKQSGVIEAKRKLAQQQLVRAAASLLNGELIESIRRDKEQTIDHDNIDRVLRAEWDKDAAGNAQALTSEFADYLRGHQDNIEALTIFFSQPYRRRELSFDLIRRVLDKLKIDQPKLAPLCVWQAYRQLDDYKGAQLISKLTALVALIRDHVANSCAHKGNLSTG